MRQVTGADHQFSQHPESQQMYDPQAAQGARHKEQGVLARGPGKDGGSSAEQGEEERQQKKWSGTQGEPFEGSDGKSYDQVNGEDVAEDLEDPVEPIFGGAETAGVMFDGDLGNPGPGHAGQSRKEAMHFPVAVNRPDTFGPVGLQGAPVVVKMYAGGPGDKEVGNSRRENAGKMILPIFAPAADDVISLVHFGQQPGNIGGVVLQVPVHGHDDLPPGMVEAGDHGRGLAIVATEFDGPELGGAGFQPFDDFPGLVPGSVVDENNFVSEGEMARNLENPEKQFLHGLLFIKKRDDDAEINTSPPNISGTPTSSLHVNSQLPLPKTNIKLTT